MQFDHFVFTRFCYRNAFRHLKGNGESFDPLAEDFLEMHINLLEMVCLPSILSQTDQDFSWVIIIDKELPGAWRERLKRLVAVRERTHLVEFRGNDLVVGTEWVNHLVLPGTEYLLTTILDDDDSMCTEYIESVKLNVMEDARENQLAPIKVLASKQIIQWELTFSDEAPYGFKCPWHRMRTEASSCGFTLGCRYPGLDLSVLGLKHMVAFNYLDFEASPKHPMVSEFRDILQDRCEIAGFDLHGYPIECLNKDMSVALGPVLVTNHGQNSEQARLSEKKVSYEVVTGPDFFENYVIDWDVVERNRHLFLS